VGALSSTPIIPNPSPTHLTPSTNNVSMTCFYKNPMESIVIVLRTNSSDSTKGPTIWQHLIFTKGERRIKAIHLLTKKSEIGKTLRKDCRNKRLLEEGSLIVKVTFLLLTKVSY
jgi:hypothetical protein